MNNAQTAALKDAQELICAICAHVKDVEINLPNVNHYKQTTNI